MPKETCLSGGVCFPVGRVVDEGPLCPVPPGLGRSALVCTPTWRHGLLGEAELLAAGRTWALEGNVGDIFLFDRPAGCGAAT